MGARAGHETKADICFQIGCNFDERLLDGICLVNQNARIGSVCEFYGAIRAHAWLSARPAYRVPDIDIDDLCRFVAKCRNRGIGFNYLLNTPYAGSKRAISARLEEIRDIVRRLVEMGVTSISVATPLIAEIVRGVSSAVGLEVSTVAHIDTVTQIKIWKEIYGARSVCGNLLKNRSITFLRAAASYCRRVGVTYELIVNEFCTIGSIETGSSATHCIYRESCYLCHAENQTHEDALLLGSYPMGMCIRSRSRPEVWLKSHFIRPEDVSRYVALGINHFKITGRTGTTDYLLAIGGAYTRGCWDGNLLGLWKNLETIAPEGDELTFKPSCYIDNSKLGRFMDYWFGNPQHDCASEVCGETCVYCDKYLSSLGSAR